MKRTNEKRVLLFWTYNPSTDKLTITDGNNTETYTGRNLYDLVRDFKEWHFITAPALLIRY